MTILTRERRKGIFFLEVVSQQSSPRLLLQLSEWPTEQSRKFHLAHESSHPSFGWLLHFQSTPEAEHVFNLEHSSQVRLFGGGGCPIIFLPQAAGAVAGNMIWKQATSNPG